MSSGPSRGSIGDRSLTRDPKAPVRGPGGPSAWTQDRTATTARQWTHTQTAQAEARHQTLNSRMLEHRQRMAPQSNWSVPRDPGARANFGVHAGVGTYRPLYLHARYYDRPDLVRYGDRHISMYYDPYNHLHHRIIWPSYYYPVYYPFGRGWHLDYVWPYYHRKYVFISLGGWWPYDYDYMRYYWYGYHPYAWYGYYPIPYEVGGDYYTYNYNYYGDDGSSTTYSSNTPIDPATQAQLRAQMDQQKAAGPAPQTLADTRFDEGVKSFEAGDYAGAAAKFDEARNLAPNDMILPFAYSQALFANGQYDQAAEVLRQALKNVTPEKEGVFFPRGLYANDDVLYGQIDKLLDKADQAVDNSDLQLLLGYQLLGVGETGYAREQLEQARQDPKNAASAAILLTVVDKMEKEAGPSLKAGGSEAPKPAVPQGNQADTATRGTLEKKLSAPRPGTSDEAKSTAGSKAPAKETPTAPAETVPATPPQEKPSSMNQGGTGTVSASNLAATEDAAVPAENAAPAPEAQPPVAPTNDDDQVGMVPQGDKEATVAQAAFLDRSAGVGLVPGLSRLLNRHGPNYRVDMVIFASILSLALAGLWIEWRLPGRQPV